MLLASRILIGILLLLLGRRLYWLFVAAVGFLTGLELAPRLLPPQSETMVMIVALALALVGALIAVVATKLVVGIVGFAAGGAIAALLLPSVNLAIAEPVIQLGVCVVAGIIGAVLLLVLFDWALIVLSSLAGATLIVVTVEPLLDIPRIGSSAAIIVLALIGTLIQLRGIVTRDSRPG